MKTKSHGRRRPLDQQASRVTLLEVDQNVSKVFSMAQERPVTVYRYRSPYAVVLSTDMWVGASKVEHFVPSHSPLVRIKDAIDLKLRVRKDPLDALPVGSRMQMAPDQAIRALLLQVLHSIPTEAKLHDQIMANMSFRWFVGMQINARLWDCHRFAEDLRTLQECEQAMEILLELAHLALLGGSQCGDLNVNIALARSWALRHPKLRKRVPLEDYQGGNLILMPRSEASPVELTPPP